MPHPNPPEMRKPQRPVIQIDPWEIFSLTELEARLREFRNDVMDKLPMSRKQLRGLLSEWRKPGTIWARRLGKYWMIPGFSVLNYLAGLEAPGICRCCGQKIPQTNALPETPTDLHNAVMTKDERYNDFLR